MERRIVQLIPMGDEAFRVYLETAVAEYAHDKVSAGNWLAEDALQLSEQAFRKFLPDGLQTENNHFYLIFDGAREQAVGMTWFEMQVSRLRKSAFILDFVIYEAFRRQGYGLEALEAVERQARQMGVSKIDLHVFAHNQAARALYEKAGFQVTNISMSKNLEE